MLIGEHAHNLDAKRRLAIPSKFRKELGEGAILTRGLDNCLFIFPSKYWMPFAEMLAGLSMAKQDTRSFARLFLSAATEVEFDSLGRILVPERLKKYAGLKKSVVVAGLFNRLEIWDEDKWNDYKLTLEKNSDSIAEKLGELGMI
ncbi:MAG: cell division/cell wall cluster transcriptional repressor MraZ [Candidatus Yanofskybacteria bacterium RIFCSPHIGHO2_01_FULL_41_27]|uniref:Transcriptional regulator MraZ n=3 Tax=Parcubacteria group TaxID=1794811 RepID=A0A1F8HQ75_9BACT|nr:MAG: Protein MraZ [Candidatus Jorgensenbacteria bacterium GW2011_GWF2_41_8]OGN00172.1 MAG: cell division/cell wall cluster transcriptional repressor MraZ [Candidatus Yanofskybacteria bacterium RIFCSPHIGHO2_01_FULL_41_27]OGN09331.1 MAG: cell division/cell wall cluster transcriptional repressor MraZ [Candidatus Yanofskybacteria bacterium RIFCSPHIGHO2_02_FULL_41_12]OGN20832.1 MAG: cell division/cell wall cluster transcriptional repressor MraZ [Candidatus Yanofskybacteria bacterium RIFCSPLOWO2_01